MKGKTSFSSNVGIGLGCDMKRWNRVKHQFQIRKEELGDAKNIGCVIQTAFGRQNEANFVAMMREAKKIVISLVAICEQRLVGHVLFSEVTVTPSPNGFSGIALGPIAVLPGFPTEGYRVASDSCRA